jgi:copper chaperone CopZ
MLNKFHLSLHGIKCRHCLATVKHALQRESGVEKVEIDQESRTASVESYTSVETLIAAVNAAGYDATVINSTEEECV